MKFPPYPRYKDSGIDWIGDIPKHWGVNRLKYLGESMIGITYSPDDVSVDGTGILVLRSSNIQNGALEFEDCVYVKKEIQSKHLTSAGDILLCARNGSAQLVGKSAFIDEKSSGLTFGAFMTVFRSQFGKFLYYFFNSEIFKSQTGLFSTSTINQLTSDTLNNLFITFPFDKNEQKAIAEFLDAETIKLDELLSKQEQLIEVLQEKRQALISQAVTKGLNPDAPHKDSGIAWLGEVPAHWEVLRNKVIFKEVDERSLSGDEELLTVSHITGVTPRSEKEVNMFLAESLEGYKRCKRGDLIINTMWAFMGALGLTDYDGVVSPSYNVYRLRRLGQVYPKYLDYLYRTPNHIVEILRYSKGIWDSRLRLYPDAFLSLCIALPTYEEQKQIVEFIDHETMKIDCLINKARQASELLQEHRAALISSAVTGKIDVRQYRNGNLSNH